MRRGKQGERGASNSALPLVAQRGAPYILLHESLQLVDRRALVVLIGKIMPHIRVPNCVDRKRRELIALLGGAIAWPLVAHAQQAGKVWQIGYLGFGTAAAFADRGEALRAGLRDLGYVEGKNIVIEFRWAETVEQLQEAAAELVRMNVDVIFATSSAETERARQATNTIPIVFATHADPVGLGHVASLPRPGGNITGLSVQLTETTAKQLGILKESVPQATRIGVLWSPTAPSYRPFLQAAEAASGKLSVQLLTAGVSTVADFDGAFATMARDRVDGVLVHGSSLTARHNPRLLAELALKHRLPTIFSITSNVEAGGLMSYASDTLDLTRRSAAYIDKILKGAKPADLPVEQASRYQLVINLKTANALGLTIPPSILARADEVIE
jgi:putative ABC transport system substrate-binding protein